MEHRGVLERICDRDARRQYVEVFLLHNGHGMALASPYEVLTVLLPELKLIFIIRVGADLLHFEHTHASNIPHRRRVEQVIQMDEAV